LGAVAALALAAGAARADDFQPKTAGLVMLNVRVTDVDPVAGDSIKTAAGAATGLKANVTSDVAPTIGLTYFFTPNWAVEVIAGASEHTVKANGPNTDVAAHTTWVLPPVVAVQYHFLPNAQISPYVGAGVNAMLFFDGQNKNGVTVNLPDAVGGAVQGGVDIALGGKWSANIDVKKVFVTTKASINGGTLNSQVALDPLVVSAGVGYKF
jgi:outer membrane protein